MLRVSGSAVEWRTILTVAVRRALSSQIKSSASEEGVTLLLLSCLAKPACILAITYADRLVSFFFLVPVANVPVKRSCFPTRWTLHNPYIELPVESEIVTDS